MWNVEIRGHAGTPERVGLYRSRLCVVADGPAEGASVHRDGARLLMHCEGRAWTVTDHSRAAAARQGDTGGDGKPMLTLEAMKMEHVHAAPPAGRVSALHVSTGEQVAARRVVAEIEALVAG